MAGRPKKEFQEYLVDATKTRVGHKDYIKSPAVAFLKHVIEAKSAIDLCIRTLPKRTNGDFTKNSLDTIQYLTSSVLPTIMGHFETYQRYLFAGMFDMSVYLEGFKINNFLKKITKDNQSEISINLERLSAYRNIGTNSIGLIIADNLKGWHNPEKVNNYFNAFLLNYQFISNENIKRINILWQLRHSIVHTGGTLTLPDAEKLPELNQWGNKRFVFQNNFIYEVARKIHPIIKEGTEGLGNRFKHKLKSNLNQEILDKIDDFFKVKSSISVWLR